MAIHKRLPIIRASLCAFALLWLVPHSFGQQSIAVSTRTRTTDRAVVGGSTFGDVLRVIGSPTTSSGNGTINPAVIDADGDVLEDSNTTVSTAGAWTWGGAGLFNSTLAVLGNTTITGNLIGGTGNLLVTSPTHFTGSSVGLAALGASNVRVGVNSTSPRVILEDVGFPQWEVDNVDGLLRIVRMDSAGTIDNQPLQFDGNINVGPLGRRILPTEPYGVDLGSQQYKFGALWTGDLYADRLVTIENIGTIDNRWLIGSGNVLDQDLAPAGTAMITRYNNYASGTFIYLQKFARTEFIKTTSGPTLTNAVLNGSFENGATTSWSGSSASVSAVTTKSFHGEYSMLVDASANPSFAAYGALSFITGTTYTVCVNARRVDGAAMADGAIGIFIRDSFVDVPAQQTQTDGWYRFCRTAAAGSHATTFLSIATKGVDLYLDAVQVEATNRERPYSEYRAVYTISRNEEGGSSVANQWYAGDGMFGVGANTGDGWIDCYALRGIKSATEQGPGCVVNVRTGSSFNSWAPRVAWGNLDGLYGYSGTTYGFAAGSSSAAWIGFDSTNGLRGMYNTTKKFGIDMSGVASLVEGAVTIDNLGIRILNTASTSDETKGFTFIGNATYTKRPGMFYHEVGGDSELVLSNDSKTSGNGLIVLSADTLSLSGSTSVLINGSTTFSGTCSAASFTVVRGMITSC